MSKKICAFFIAILFTLSTINVSAQRTILVSTRQQGLVVDVLDGDALVVKLHGGTNVVYVRLLGVEARGNTDAMEYLISNVQGKNVIVEPDYTGNVTLVDGRWNFLYVYINDGTEMSILNKEMVNESLIKKGYAAVNTEHKNIAQYTAFIGSEKTAKTSQLGVWSASSSKGYYYSGDLVNINTATNTQLRDLLSGMPNNVANNIISYRTYNPFRSIYEVKFVEGMTKELFDKNVGKMSVITNINTASEKELKTLMGATDTDVKNIVILRGEQSIEELTELYRLGKLNQSFYDKNYEFMSTEEKQTIKYAIPDTIVNINTASYSQISNIPSFSDSFASAISSGKYNGYTYKTFFELKKLSGVTYSDKELLKHEDNLHLYTDLNSASDDELKSLFGSNGSTIEYQKIKAAKPFNRLSEVESILGADIYSKIKPYIYLDDITRIDRININTANESQLRAVGFTSNQAGTILNKSRSIYSSRDIPFNISTLDHLITLYTNINTASEAELRSLNVLTTEMINNIIAYRNDQPFGSYDEIEKFFKDYDSSSLYYGIKEFIVVK